MREILFRGKSNYGNVGEWEYGLVAQPHVTENGIVTSYYFTKICENGWTSQRTVSANTIGQYTGLTDKNGKKIYEGDIVKEVYEVFVSARKREKRTRIGYVEYSDCSFCNGYYAYFWYGKEKWRGNFAIHHGCEVIGNIYDNPELLKGGAE